VGPARHPLAVAALRRAFHATIFRWRTSISSRLAATAVLVNAVPADTPPGRACPRIRAVHFVLVQRRIWCTTLLSVLSLLAGCTSQGGPSTSASPSVVPGTPSAKSIVTTSAPSQLPSPSPTGFADEDQVKAIVTDYFDAAAAGDNPRGSALTTGDLHKRWATDVQAYGRGSGFSNTSAAITSFSFDHEGSSGEVFFHFAATVTGDDNNGNPFTIHYTGPLVVRKVGSTYKVLDYVRSGRSVSEATFTHLEGVGAENRGEGQTPRRGLVLGLQRHLRRHSEQPDSASLHCERCLPD
jgi:hypothetical protein